MEKSKKKELLDWIKSIAVAFVFVIAMRTFIFSPILVDGASMMPTYEDGDRVIVNKISKQIFGIERFDVIVFEAPTGENYIKRVLGLPGDHVAYENDILYINGESVKEPYLDLYKEQLLDNGTLTQDLTLESLTGYTEIPEGYLFVLGDNRRFSSDTRDPKVGLVPLEKVLGKANVRFYPFDSVGIVK
ncbi:signal peptidase I [Lysinibacillus mangiferihumi]|uniref:Signal peptidase I n=1 Tax=Lysinibacillus mangiferihumi TaxID=1130819 RepID=A0A4U2Y007_9BACI|nr:signal peptidase I [Lysinibacillus mangiferihumi]TKI53630.1 signal peptidase I [Lysinibacillus mangiferihumi]